MELIPWYSNEENKVYDGDIIPLPRWCKKHFNSKCDRFYRSLKDKEGFKVCPYGFTAYVKKIGTTNIIYTGLLVDKYYIIKLIKQKIANDKNRFKYSEEEFYDLLEKTLRYNEMTFDLKNEIESLKKQLDKKSSDLKEHILLTTNTLHEVRSLNKTLKSQSEDILQTTSKYIIKDENDYFGFRIKNINATTNLLTVRLQSYDILSDSSYASVLPSKEIFVYNKFYKTKQLLSTFFHENNIKFNFIGNSYSTTYGSDLFELLPYLAYENFIKYSLPNKYITTSFSETSSDVLVKIEGYGPQLGDEEIGSIFEKGFRGKSALVSSIPGSGIGLHLCKIICDMYGFSISATSDRSVFKTINKTKYSKFELTFTFKICSKKLEAS